jgi:hypothetical protein
MGAERRRPAGGLRQLRGIEDTDWAQRRTLQVGNCLDTPVWWSEADGRVDVLVCEDDEVRAVAVTVPLSTVHEVLALAEKELQQSLHPVPQPRPPRRRTNVSPRSCPARPASYSAQLLLRQDSRQPGRITAPARPPTAGLLVRAAYGQRFPVARAAALPTSRARRNSPPR